MNIEYFNGALHLTENYLLALVYWSALTLQISTCEACAEEI